MNQAKANELNIGILGFYHIASTEYEPMLGFAWRNKDALVFHLGLKRKTFSFRISYDVNISYLKKYDNNGLEFSVIYSGKNKNPAAARISVEEEIKKQIHNITMLNF